MSWFTKYNPFSSSTPTSTSVEVKQVPAAELLDYWSETGLIPKIRSTRAGYREVSREGYMQNSAVYAAIEELCSTFAGVKWRIYKDQTPDGNVPIPVPDFNHPLNKVITRPNPDQSWQLLMKKICATWLLGGSFHLHRTRPNLELRVLRHDQMTPMQNALGEIVGWEQRFDNGTKRVYAAADVRYVKDFHPLSDDGGFARLGAAAYEIDITNEGAKWNSSLLRNGARLSGILKTPNNLSETQFNRIQSEKRALNQGAENAGNLMITEGGLEFQAMGMTPQGMDHIEGTKAYRRHIWSVLNTPPELVGDSEAKTYSNYKEARQALYQENVLPLLDLVVAELNLWITPGDDASFGYDTSDIEALQPDRDKLHERNRKDVESGLITVNEGRENIGLQKSDDPEADKLRIPPDGFDNEQETPLIDPGPGTGSQNGNSE